MEEASKKENVTKENENINQKEDVPQKPDLEKKDSIEETLICQICQVRSLLESFAEYYDYVPLKITNMFLLVCTNSSITYTST